MGYFAALPPSLPSGCSPTPISTCCKEPRCKDFLTYFPLATQFSAPFQGYDEIAMAHGAMRCPVGYYMDMNTNSCAYLGLDSIRCLGNNNLLPSAAQMLLDIAAFGPGTPFGQYQAGPDEIAAAAFVINRANDCEQITY
jgi:hypothetical protein